MIKFSLYEKKSRSNETVKSSLYTVYDENCKRCALIAIQQFSASWDGYSGALFSPINSIQWSSFSEINAKRFCKIIFSYWVWRPWRGPSFRRILHFPIKKVWQKYANNQRGALSWKLYLCIESLLLILNISFEFIV